MDPFWEKTFCFHITDINTIAPDAKFNSKMIETHLKYVLPLSAMDKALAYITGHLIWPKNPVQMLLNPFENKNIHNFSEKKNLLIKILLIFFLQLSIHECVQNSIIAFC